VSLVGPAGFTSSLALTELAVDVGAGVIEVAVLDDACHEQHAVDATVAAVVKTVTDREPVALPEESATAPAAYDVRMGKDARTLLTEALELAVDDRAELAAELLASLDEPTPDSQEEVDRLWAAEIGRRSNRVLSGESSGEPWDEARRRIESDLTAR
jgi:hypothetical protein